MFKYENVSDGAIDYESEEYFVGIAAVVENASEYRKVRYLRYIIHLCSCYQYFGQKLQPQFIFRV